MSLTSQTNNNFVTSIQTPTDTVGNAIGLNDIDSLRRNLNDVQKMVSFDNKAIYANIIGKYDKTPIEVIDPIRFLGSASGVEGIGSGSDTFVANGNHGLYLFNNLSTPNGIIQFIANSTTIARFDSNYHFIYDLQGIGNPQFEIRGNLLTERLTVRPSSLSHSVSSMFLKATDNSGEAIWSHVTTMERSSFQAKLIADGPNNWQQGLLFKNGTSTLGFIDANANFTIGNPDYAINGDLKSSNSVLVTSNFRFRKEGSSVGKILGVTNVFGDIGYFNPNSIETYLTDQITSGNTSVIAQSNSISFAINSLELARFTSNGFLGIANPLPEAGIDNCNTTILRSSLRYIPNPNVITTAGEVLVSQDNQGTAKWEKITQIGSDGNTLSFSDGNRPMSLKINNKSVLFVRNISNIVASANEIPMSFDVSGAISAFDYKGYFGRPIQFTSETGRILTSITQNGRVGIGTTTPSNTLEVVGTINATQEITTSQNITAGGNIVTNSGFIGGGSRITNIQPVNVGIGTNNLAFFQLETRERTSFLGSLVDSCNSTLSSAIFSIYDNLSSQVSSSTRTNFSTLSSQIKIVYDTLSTADGVNLSNQRTFSENISNTISFRVTTNLSTLSSSIRLIYDTLSTADFAIDSTIRNNLTSSLTGTTSNLSTLISTVSQNANTFTSTNIGLLSTLIGPGFYQNSTMTFRYIDEQVNIAKNNFVQAAEIVIQTIRTGLTAQQLVVGSALTNPRKTTAFNGVLDVSGHSIFGPSSRIFISTGGGITIGHKTLADSSGAVDICGNMYATTYGGHRKVTFQIADKVVGEFGTDGSLKLGRRVSTMSNMQTSLDVSGNIELTGLILKNGKPYSLTPIFDFYWGKTGSNVYVANGRVGIGTTEPQFALDVMGDIRCKSLTVMGMRWNTLSSIMGSIINADATWSTNGAKLFYTGGPVGIGEGNTNPLFSLDVSGTAHFRGGNSYFSTIGVGYLPNSDLSGSLDVNGNIYAKGFGGGNTDPFRFLLKNREVARFGTDGRFMVGMSNQSPFGTGVDISGNLNLTGKIFKSGIEVDIGNSWNRTGTNLVYTAGNIGIGTNNPQNMLDVAGTIRCQAIQIVKVVEQGNGNGVGTTLETTVFYLESTTRNAFYADKGNVGIGTSTPTSRLTVIGDILATSTIRAPRIQADEFSYKTLAGIIGENIELRTQIKGFSSINSLQALSSGIIAIGPGLRAPQGIVTISEGSVERGTFLDIIVDTAPPASVFSFTSATTSYIFTLPDSVTSVDIYGWGAGGGKMLTNASSARNGGGGASVKGTRAALPYQQYRLTIGSAGRTGSVLSTNPSGGGGFTKLEFWTGVLWKLLFTLGGGGGAGTLADGGSSVASGIAFQGGNFSRTINNGININQNVFGSPNGGGASEIVGGAGGSVASGPTATAGGFEIGGIPNSPNSTGAGGGAGHYGGGGGVTPGSGGGGSSFVSDSDFTNLIKYNSSGALAGNSSSIYRSGAGRGGTFELNSADGGIIFVVNSVARKSSIMRISEGSSEDSGADNKTYLDMDRKGNLAISANFTTSSILTSSINGMPVVNSRSAWSSLETSTHIPMTASNFCSANIILETSSFVHLMANINATNITINTPLAGYMYVTLHNQVGNLIRQSQSAYMRLLAGSATSLSLSHREYIGPGTYTTGLWSYGESGLSTVRADLSVIGHLF